MSGCPITSRTYGVSEATMRSLEHRRSTALRTEPRIASSGLSHVSRWSSSLPDQLISTLNFFTTSGTMVRRDAALAVGGFHKWWGVEDFDLWVRVLEQYTGICSRRVTALYHIHDAQLSLEAERMLHERRRGSQVASGADR